MRTLKALAGLVAVIFIGVMVWLFLVFPRVVNMLADLLGTNPEEPTHWIPALIVTAILLLIAYFGIIIPYRRFRATQDGQGLIVERGQGRAFMDTESARQQVYAAVTKIPNVQRTEVTIVNELGRALVTMNILADNTINGPKKKQEISRETKKVIQDQLGIQLASEPTINISLEPIGAEVPHASSDMTPLSSKSVPRAVPPDLPRSEPARSAVPIERKPVESLKSLPSVEPTKPAEPVRTLSPVESPRTVELVKPLPPVEPQTPEPVVSALPAESVVEKPDEGSVLTNADTTPLSTMRPFARRPFVPPGGVHVTEEDLAADKPAPSEEDKKEWPDLDEKSATDAKDQT